MGHGFLIKGRCGGTLNGRICKRNPIDSISVWSRHARGNNFLSSCFLLVVTCSPDECHFSRENGRTAMKGSNLGTSSVETSFRGPRPQKLSPLWSSSSNFRLARYSRCRLFYARIAKEEEEEKRKRSFRRNSMAKKDSVRAVMKRRGGQAPRKVERRREQFREVWPGQMGKLRFEEILNYSQRFETVHPCFTQWPEKG